MARHPQYDRDTALSKAVSLFWEKGYHGSSMKQIEQALDMRPGSIYAAFGSKDGLYNEALANYARLGGVELTRHMAQYGTIIEGLQDYLRSIVRNGLSACPSRACMIVKTLLETSNTHGDLASQADGLLHAIEQTLTGLLEQAKAHGELAAGVDCSRLARLVQAQIMGLRSIAERKLTETQLACLADDMADVLNHYRATH